MKKVAFLVNSLANGGGEKVVSTIVNELSKIEEIELILFENDIFYEIDTKVKLTVLNIPLKININIIKLLLLPILAWKLARYINAQNIEVVNSHLYRANYINVLAKIFGGKHKAIIVNHGDPYQYKQKGLLGKINLFLIKKLYPKSDLIISISKVMKNRLLTLVPKAKIEVINNPYDIKSISNLSGEHLEFSFKANKKYLVCMGRLIPLKRFADTIIAISRLEDSVELIILGDGIEKANLEKIAQSRGVEKRIHFEGNVKNPFAYLKKSDIFVLSSESEGFPNSIIEAFTCKVPIVSTDCISGPREILSPNTNSDLLIKNELELAEFGILYPVGNIDFLVEAISLLLNNNTIREDYIQKSYERANDFAVSKIIKKYKKILEID